MVQHGPGTVEPILCNKIFFVFFALATKLNGKIYAEGVPLYFVVVVQHVIGRPLKVLPTANGVSLFLFSFTVPGIFSPIHY